MRRVSLTPAGIVVVRTPPILASITHIAFPIASLVCPVNQNLYFSGG